ncbi:MAG: hypothetical protein A2504_11850 [Bdellovibrionales bacterium RIFOXYD12_FULL_39_22]|nr:MAG: hypothetical protein A2385_16365 [Bdellovibrionales bacterium RIFOXYB1_FULL_39_21]OFZ44469.1 MAG: hypothetical protein A2485_06530 [Bdellovibrionales bacterium RIFOXYC12_FULL_39_17]OFZ49889.1 MAG: hypothetical protein A2404_00935 [Bdellovibrionales bacterium RIFOXYC1_FULL_39_130]OFZ76894.1 MAG: hypothetical protein A2560_05735 [Bdellovibrionales bacterium RIFOXYD1_FULL_39_84]OFZ95821.1 MAG: hypothetical protein A2504_11850 [Bdellovibrionales bacterium RIFOXYD12_FULL_39_22]HLE10841.1 RN
MMATYSEIEGRCLEFKEKLTTYQQLYKTVVAFANDVGGKIIIGVQDKDRKIIGVNEHDLDRYLEEIPRAIYEAITPALQPAMAVKLMSGKQLLEIEVFPGNKKPYFIKSKGLPAGVYIRIGSHSVPASADILEDLQRMAGSENFDSGLAPGVTVQELDPLALKSYYGKHYSQERLVSDKIIIRDPFSGKLAISFAGVLFFHPHPEKIFPQCEILFTKFATTDTKKISRSIDFHGPLISLVDEVLTEVQSHLARDFKLKGARLSAQNHIIPEEALRESLMNAVIHRKYYLSDAIKIALFSDRLEIFSPGNFPGPIVDLRSGVSYSRNSLIRQIARNAGLVEKRGLGLIKILDTCQHNGNPPPDIYEGEGDFVKVVFYLDQNKKIKEQSIVDYNSWPTGLVLLREWHQEKRAFTLKELAALLQCSRNTAKSKIEFLLTKKFLYLKGAGPSTRYEWQ